MSTRKGFETALEDIKNEFSYLENYGFVCSGETQKGDRVSRGYLGKKYNLVLAYEFIGENFDFSLIKKSDPSVYKPIWKIIQENDLSFDHSQI